MSLPLWSVLCLDAHKILFVPSKTGVSGSLSPLEGLWSNAAGPQGQIPWGFSVPLLDPQAGIQNLHNAGRTSLVLLFSSLWVTHLAGMGFDFIVIASLLLSCCSFFFVFGRGVCFFVGSSVLLIVVQQVIAILVLLPEEISTHPSTLPSWARRPVVFYIYPCCYFCWCFLLPHMSSSYCVVVCFILIWTDAPEFFLEDKITRDKIYQIIWECILPSGLQVLDVKSACNHWRSF